MWMKIVQSLCRKSTVLFFYLFTFYNILYLYTIINIYATIFSIESLMDVVNDSQVHNFEGAKNRPLGFKTGFMHYRVGGTCRFWRLGVGESVIEKDWERVFQCLLERVRMTKYTHFRDLVPRHVSLTTVGYFLVLARLATNLF